MSDQKEYVNVHVDIELRCSRTIRLKREVAERIDRDFSAMSGSRIAEDIIDEVGVDAFLDFSEMECTDFEIAADGKAPSPTDDEEDEDDA